MANAEDDDLNASTPPPPPATPPASYPAPPYGTTPYGGVPPGPQYAAPQYGAGYGSTPYGPSQPYSAGGGLYPPVRDTNTKALLSLIAGIGSFVVCPGILGVVAVILGNSASDEIRASLGAQDGDSLAKAGVILGWISIAIVLAFLVGMVVLFCIGIVVDN